MYQIQWHKKGQPWAKIVGLSKYPTKKSAEEQVKKWQMWFSQNIYLILFVGQNHTILS